MVKVVHMYISLVWLPELKLNLDPILKVDAEDFENKEHLEIMEKEKGIKMEPDANNQKTKMSLSAKRKMVCKIFNICKCQINSLQIGQRVLKCLKNSLNRFKYSRLRNKRRGMLINLWKKLKKKYNQKWPQCLDWCTKVLKLWCENF